MTASKPPTPQAISALLRKAGFNRAADRPGGFNSEGFRIIPNRDGDGIVLVKWWEDSAYKNDPAKQKAMLKRYSDAITAAGYTVELTTYAGAPDVSHLTVRALRGED